jgi:hypothetical protein
MEGREHTVVKVVRPRKKFVLQPFTLSFTTITGRRKKSLPDLPLSVRSSFDFDTFRFYLLEVEG